MKLFPNFTRHHLITHTNVSRHFVLFPHFNLAIFLNRKINVSQKYHVITFFKILVIIGFQRAKTASLAFSRERVAQHFCKIKLHTPCRFHCESSSLIQIYSSRFLPIIYLWTECNMIIVDIVVGPQSIFFFSSRLTLIPLTCSF